VSTLQEELTTALEEDGRRLKSLVMEIDFAEEHATILLRSTLNKPQVCSMDAVSVCLCGRCLVSACMCVRVRLCIDGVFSDLVPLL
jgi:hypothetical protein